MHAEASIKNDDTPIINQPNIDSVAIMAFRATIEEATGLGEEDLNDVVVDENTTLMMMVDKIAEKTVQMKIAEYLDPSKKKKSSTSAANAPTMEEEAKEEEAQETAPTVEKVSLEEILAECSLGAQPAAHARSLAPAPSATPMG